MTRGELFRRGAVAGAGLLGAGFAFSAMSDEGRPSSHGVFADVTAFGARGDGVTDDSRAFQRAHDAVAPHGGTIHVPRGVYVLAKPLRFARGNRRWVRLAGQGRKETIIKGGGANGQLAQFAKVADYDTFRRIEIADLAFDAGHSARGAGHVILGVLPWTDKRDDYQTRLHLEDIAVRRVHAYNVPVDEARPITGVHLSGVAETSADTRQLNVRDIVVEDVRVDGGTSGVVVFGTARHGTLRDGKVRVFLDRIELSRCRHDTTVVPTGIASHANYQIGGVGFGGSVRIRDCYGANSGDVGLEIDGMTDAVIERCTIVDAWQNHFLAANFRRPANLAMQRYVYVDCVARSVNVDPDINGAQPHHWGLQGDARTPHFAFGHLVLVGCRSRTDTPLRNFSVRGSVVFAARAHYRQITIRGLNVRATRISVANEGTESPSLVDIAPLNAAIVDVSDVYFLLQGKRTGAGVMFLRFIRLSGNVTGHVRDVTAEALVTGMTPARDIHRVVDVGDISGSLVSADVSDVRLGLYGSPANAEGVHVNRPRGTPAPEALAPRSFTGLAL